MVLGEGLRVTALGIIVGSIGPTRVAPSLLFGVEPTDPPTLLAVALFITLVPFVACFLPARRATLVDPMETLRDRDEIRGSFKDDDMPATTPALDLRYPIGTFSVPAEVTDERRREWIGAIAATPANLRGAVRGLNETQLETPYRDGGWTIRQVVHHLPDSHMNALLRFKHALTEENPVIKAYDESAWALLADVAATPIETSLSLLEALHERWVALIRGFRPSDYQRAYFHPEKKRLVPLDEAIGMYAWHGRHHVAHITSLRARKGW